MLESTLVDNTFSQIPQYLDLGQNYLASREIPAGRRFIDILYVDLNDDFENHDLSLSKIASLNSRQLSVLSFFIDGKRKTKHYITKYFNVEWGSLRKDYLGVFKQKGLIKQIGSKTFQTTDWLEVVPNKIISIEAKIEDWKSVIAQAKYNTDYTNESYILFPDYTSKINQEQKVDLKKDNIGVFTADSSFNIKFEHQPRFKKTNSNSHISDYMKLAILKSYYKNPIKWEK